MACRRYMTGTPGMSTFHTISASCSGGVERSYSRRTYRTPRASIATARMSPSRRMRGCLKRYCRSAMSHCTMYVWSVEIGVDTRATHTYSAKGMNGGLAGNALTCSQGTLAASSRRCVDDGSSCSVTDLSGSNDSVVHKFCSSMGGTYASSSARLASYVANTRTTCGR